MQLWLEEIGREHGPAGQPLNYNLRNSTYAYIGSRKRCGPCALKAQCTSGAFRYLAIHSDEPARQRARELATTPEFAHAQRQRKKVEALFAELKNQIGLRRLRLRRLKFVREQFLLAAAAQNIKRLEAALRRVSVSWFCDALPRGGILHRLRCAGRKDLRHTPQ